MTHGEIRQYEYKFKKEIFAILRKNNLLLPYMNFNIEMSSEYEDQKLSYDMKFNGMIELSVRIRKNEYLKYKDFTIRSKSQNGYKCEIDKLIDGAGYIYFYGWMNKQETAIVDWILVNINMIRNELLQAGTFRNNNDNTGFMFYSIDWLNSHNAIIATAQPVLTF